MFRSKISIMWFGVVSCLLLLVSGCVTGAGDVPYADVGVSQEETEKPTSPTGVVTLNVEHRALGLVIRDIAEQSDAGLVLMNGLENYPVKGFEIEDASAQDTLTALGVKTGYSTHVTPHYTFFYDPAYEVLVTMNIRDDLPASYRDVQVTASFGSDTPVFTVFALLSRLTGKTLVADNAVADSLCGELNLRDVPLPEALEAVLQSARMPRRGFKIRTTDDYIFVYSAAHSLRKNVASKEISAEGRRLLQEECSISLLVYTEEDNKIRSQLGASRLYKAVSEFSLQLGLPIRIEEDLQHFPVNPVVMNGVTRETALKLFINQWLVPQFEFTMVDDTVVIRRASTR